MNKFFTEVRKFPINKIICLIKAVGEPNKIKRPWLSIIKQLTKTKYNMASLDYHFTENGKHIRTQMYNFIKN
jgi:hypothetical protein